MASPFPATIPAREITPEEVFFQRRRFMKQTLGMGLVGASSLACSPTTSAGQLAGTQQDPVLRLPFERPGVFPPTRNETYPLPKGVEGELTPRRVAALHNNYYEFLPGQGGQVYKHTGAFKAEPWKVEISGSCRNPMTLDLDDLFKFEHEERLYHFRCVERWAMNIPWSGFPLSKLIAKADPKSSAKYIRFTTVNRPEQMPGMAKASYYDWPYVEALRLDEAQNELAMVVTGVYGKPLPIQHGAPVRIIVPWKYGFKNPKSVVKIEFLDRQPSTFWMIQAHEYGFLSNVNPNIPHPRWSQMRSYWLGKDDEWFDTPLFNGYEKWVAGLYPEEPREPQRALRQGQIAR